MFVLAYRNANGALRVSPRAYATDAMAKGFAAYYARYNIGRTLKVINLTSVIASANERAEKADWYCDHGPYFCAPCYYGYDHPSTYAEDYEDA